MFQLRRRALVYFNTLSISEQIASATPKWHLSLQHKRNPIAIPIYCFFSTTSTSDQQSFTLSYLTNNCGFSQEAALKSCQKILFETPQKPDSVISFFRGYGFSNTQINSIIRRIPSLLICDPSKRVLPKFEFLASKGASHSDILLMVTRNPEFLRHSLKNHIIPRYELVRRLCASDEKAIARIIGCPSCIRDSGFPQNVKLLLDEGFTHSRIYNVLCCRPSILFSYDLRKTVEELKQLGFDASKFEFGVALLAKRSVTKSQWDAKVEAFKSWGWSEQEIFDAFRRHPKVMLRSKGKLDAVMRLWVDQLGWDPSALLMSPIIFGFSLEKRLVPRAFVIQYLLSKGLMKKNASLVTPFCLSEKLFLQKFVTRFNESEMSQLLKLYQGGC